MVLNGQIMPGEVTRFPLKLHGGQQLVITAQARHLIPYLADAVPGWCQAVMALYDAEGKELAYADDNSFDPDPSFYYQVPQDGDYVLAIRDALYRGREDFVYRITMQRANARPIALSVREPGESVAGRRAGRREPAAPVRRQPIAAMRGKQARITR